MVTPEWADRSSAAGGAAAAGRAVLPAADSAVSAAAWGAPAAVARVVAGRTNAHPEISSGARARSDRKRDQGGGIENLRADPRFSPAREVRGRCAGPGTEKVRSARDAKDAGTECDFDSGGAAGAEICGGRRRSCSPEMRRAVLERTGRENARPLFAGRI